VTKRWVRRISAALLAILGLWFFLYAVLDPFIGHAAHTPDYWSSDAVAFVLGVAALIGGIWLWRRRPSDDRVRVRFGVRRVQASPLAVGDPNVVTRRVLAQVIDWIAYLLPLVAIVIVAPYLLPSSWLVTAESAYLWVPILAVANWVVLQGLTGYSLGKWLLSIRVVDEHGRPPGIWRALLRALPLAIEQYGIVAIWAMRRSPARQRFGDRWARTYVVRVQRRPRSRSSRVPVAPSA
jgi:uncharacterized RDD family membrane protein YckC